MSDITIENLDLMFVISDGLAIREIHNPSEKVKLAAVIRNSYAIELIDNPCESVIEYLKEKS